MAEFSQRLQECEIRELAKKDYGAAATQYRFAVSAARSPTETADARLDLARTLALSGNSTEANRVCQALLHDPPAPEMLVFSVGVTEASDEKGFELGEEGLLHAFHRARTREASGASEFVMDEVRKHLHEQRQPDDITLIAMKVVAEAPLPWPWHPVLQIR